MTTFWRYLLAGDWADDLGVKLDSPDGAESLVRDEWLRRTHPTFTPTVPGEPWVLQAPPKMPQFDSDWWTPDSLGRYWVNNVAALRSLAIRLHGWAGSGPSMDPHSADQRFKWHLSKCHPVAAVIGAAGPFSSTNFVGLDLEPTPVVAEEWLHLGDHPGPWAPLGFAVLRDFWVRGFASLITNDLAPRCAGCRQLLPLSPTGRRSTRRYCPKCAFRAWDSKHTQTQKRERWKRLKRDQRRKH